MLPPSSAACGARVKPSSDDVRARRRDRQTARGGKLQGRRHDDSIRLIFRANDAELSWRGRPARAPAAQAAIARAKRQATMKKITPIIALICCLALIGCAGESDHRAAPLPAHPRTIHAIAAAATTAPVPRVLKLADAVDLQTLQSAEVEANLTDQVRLARGGRIYFGQLDTYDADDNVTATRPIIAQKSGDRWSALPI